jgi:hypothetical protein
MKCFSLDFVSGHPILLMLIRDNKRNQWMKSLPIRFAPKPTTTWTVMPGLVPGIHVQSQSDFKDVDGRDEPGHDRPRKSKDCVLVRQPDRHG